jgi:hypothetical protein
MYVTAALLLAVALMPAIQGAMNYSAQAQAVAVADGVAGVLNELRPGILGVVSFQSLWGNLTVQLSGHLASAFYGGADVEEHCRWYLPSVVLYSGRLYYVRLSGGIVRVSSSV